MISDTYIYIVSVDDFRQFRVDIGETVNGFPERSRSKGFRRYLRRMIIGHCVYGSVC